MSKATRNVLELPMAERGLAALRTAVERAIVEHARQGVPMYISRDGEVVEISGDELQARARLVEADSSRRPGKVSH